MTARILVSLFWLLVSFDLGQGYHLPPARSDLLYNTTAVRKVKAVKLLRPLPVVPSLAYQIALHKRQTATTCPTGYFNCTTVTSEESCCLDGGVCCDAGNCCNPGHACVAVPSTELYLADDLGCCEIGTDCVLESCPDESYMACYAPYADYCCAGVAICTEGSNGEPVCLGEDSASFSVVSKTPSTTVSIAPEYTPNTASFTPTSGSLPTPTSPVPGSSAPPAPGSTSSGSGNSSPNKASDAQTSGTLAPTSPEPASSAPVAPTNSGNGSGSPNNASDAQSSDNSSSGLSEDGKVGLIVGVVGVVLTPLVGIPTVWFAWLTWHDNHRPGESWHIMRETMARRRHDAKPVAYPMVDMNR